MEIEFLDKALEDIEIWKKSVIFCIEQSNKQ